MAQVEGSGKPGVRGDLAGGGLVHFPSGHRDRDLSVLVDASSTAEKDQKTEGG